MILVIAVLAILLLIATVAAVTFHQHWKRAQEEAAIFKAQMQFYAENPQKTAEPAQEEEQERGAFVKVQITRTATPETYRNVFDWDVSGQRILAHLTSVYANKSSYVRGGHDAERESCFRAGQADVIGFIYKQINRANDPDYKEEVND